MSKELNTKFGKARIDNRGYWIITSGKEGNNGKKLSKETRLKLSKANIGKEHTDETKRKISEASKGRKFSEKTRRKISEAKKGTPITEEHRLKLSNIHNTSGYYRVTIIKDKKMKQGFYYQYGYMVNRKKKTISSKSIEELKQKVKSKGLKWIEYTKEE